MKKTSACQCKIVGIVLLTIFLVSVMTMPVQAGRSRGMRDTEICDEDVESTFEGVLKDSNGKHLGKGRMTFFESVKSPQIKGRITLDIDGVQVTKTIEAQKIGTVRMPVQGPFNGFWSGQVTQKGTKTTENILISGAPSWGEEIKGYSAQINIQTPNGEIIQVTFDIQ